MRKRIFSAVLLVAVCLLSGCAMRTVDQMYFPPKRSESYNNLQSVIDQAMVGKEYCAPISGENQQTVQMADLEGDGIAEYLLFAKSNSGDKPLQILIFRQQEEDYVLADTIDSNGTAFELVEYVPMDDAGGVEIVVGRQLSDQLMRSVSVYTFKAGLIEQVLNTNYTKLLTCDLDADPLKELMVLHPGQSDTDNGVAELYEIENETVVRSNEVSLSGPVDRLKRIITGSLHDGVPAVFVGSTVGNSAIITDIYAMVDGVFTNVSLSSESGTSVQTLRNYYVYAEDIDSDGEVELPNLINMALPDSGSADNQQHLIRWFSMGVDGTEINKMYTYHNYLGGWYLELGPQWASRIYVTQEGNAYEFYLLENDAFSAQKIFTIYALTGQNREELALQGNKFVLYRDESTTYAAHLEVASGVLSITREGLIKSFHPIRQDWKTGEM